MGQNSKVGAHKTTVRTDGGCTHVTYHHTCVVKFNSDEIILDSGGWRTVTSKLRMNQASNQYGLGFSVYQKDHVWYVDGPGVPLKRFSDGMVITR